MPDKQPQQTKPGKEARHDAPAWLKKGTSHSLSTQELKQAVIGINTPATLIAATTVLSSWQLHQQLSLRLTASCRQRR